MREQGSVRQTLSSTPVVGHYGSEMDTPLHSMLGLTALVETMRDLGVPARTLFAGTRIATSSLADKQARISLRQKIKLFANVRQLSPDPAIGLLAGQRQRISDLGVFGYAILSSATFGRAVDFGIRHVRLAGPVLQKSFRVEGDVAIFEGHDALELGDLLPVVSEFWFGSMNTLITHTLGRPFKARLLMLPYPAPAHAHRYTEILGYPVEFDAPVMQWHFDASLLDEPLPAANPIMADVSAGFCARMLEDIGAEPDLVREIKAACLNSVGGVPRLDEMAARLNQSTRTLQRRLLEVGCRYQDIVDDVRKRLAIEYLGRTGMSVDEVSERSGFSDVSNFRKAFKKWTGRTPAFYRPRR